MTALSPRAFRRSLAIAAILMAAGFAVPTVTPAQAAKCFASGSGEPFCTGKGCPSGYVRSGLSSKGCVTGAKLLCCPTEAEKKADFDRRDKGYKCQQLYCSKVCTGKESFDFYRPKTMSFYACQAKCNRL